MLDTLLLDTLDFGQVKAEDPSQSSRASANPLPRSASPVQWRSLVMRAVRLRLISSLLVASVAVLCMSASPAAAQSSQTRLVVFEGFYNPG